MAWPKEMRIAKTVVVQVKWSVRDVCEYRGKIPSHASGHLRKERDPP